MTVLQDDTLIIPAEHPDRYALEYIDARIVQYKHRAIIADKAQDRDEFKAIAMAFGVLRGDIRALLHRPAPVAAACEHPTEKQVPDSLPNVGATIRCIACGEHRAQIDTAKLV